MVRLLNYHLMFKLMMKNELIGATQYMEYSVNGNGNGMVAGLTMIQRTLRNLKETKMYSFAIKVK